MFVQVWDLVVHPFVGTGIVVARDRGGNAAVSRAGGQSGSDGTKEIATSVAGRGSEDARRMACRDMDDTGKQEDGEDGADGADGEDGGMLLWAVAQCNLVIKP